MRVTSWFRNTSRLFWLASGCAIAPIAGQLIRVVRSPFVPATDDAIIAIKSHEVFSAHSPLLGMASSVNGFGTHGAWPYHLGPMLFWSLSVPERLFGYRLGVVVGSALVNVIAALVALLFVRRIAGDRAALAIAAVIGLLMWSVGRGVLAEPWNPYIAVIPFVLVLVSACAVAIGDRWAFPVFVVAASYVLQCHYLFAPMAIAAGLVALAFFASAWRRVEAAARPRLRAAIVWAVSAAVVCWLPTLYQQLRNHPGNLTALLDAGRGINVRVPVATAWHWLANTLGAIPLFVRGPVSDADYVELGRHSSLVSNVVAVALVSWLVAGCVAAWRRGRFAVASCGAVALAVLLAAVFTLVSFPAEFPTIPRYRTLFLWPLSALLWSAAVGLVVARAPRLRPRSFGLSLAAVACSVAALVGSTPATQFDNLNYRATSALSGAVVGSINPHQGYLIVGGGIRGLFVQYGIMRALFEHDIAFYVPDDNRHFAPRRAVGDRKVATIVVASGAARVPAGASVLARYDGAARGTRQCVARLRRSLLRSLADQPPRLSAQGAVALASGHAIDQVLEVLRHIDHGTLAADDWNASGAAMRLAQRSGLIEAPAELIDAADKYWMERDGLRETQFVVYEVPAASSA